MSLISRSRYALNARGTLGFDAAALSAIAMSKVMESQVGELLALMRSPDASVDAKVAGINDVKSGIKHFNVPDASVPQLFDILRLAMQSQNATLVTSGFGMFWCASLRRSLIDNAQVPSVIF
jgi:hypothetical protein